MMIMIMMMRRRTKMMRMRMKKKRKKKVDEMKEESGGSLRGSLSLSCRGVSPEGEGGAILGVLRTGGRGVDATSPKSNSFSVPSAMKPMLSG